MWAAGSTTAGFMIRTLRYLIAVISAAALVLGIAVAAGWTGTGSAAGNHRLVVQTQPVVATDPVPAPVITTTSTTTPPTTTTPTTTPPPPTTAAPTTAPPTTAAKAATTKPSTQPAVAATPAVGGSASDFTLLGYRWDPCSGPITVSSAGLDVSGIVSELNSLTGLHLEMVSGPTADINLSWGSNLAGAEGGLTTWAAVGGWLSHISIVISPASVPYISTVLHHEMGHAVGLGHARQSNEVMYPIARIGSPTDYQAGDRAGLRTVGAAAGCTPSP
jgi:Matrixin